MVGISNWSLDPRQDEPRGRTGVRRPAPTVARLGCWPLGIVEVGEPRSSGTSSSANSEGYGDEGPPPRPRAPFPALHRPPRYLHALARSPRASTQQEHADFWGLREFYSTVIKINRFGAATARRAALAASSTAPPPRRRRGGASGRRGHLDAVLRNFGGGRTRSAKVRTDFFDSAACRRSVLPSPPRSFIEASMPTPTLTSGAAPRARASRLVRANAEPARPPDAAHEEQRGARPALRPRDAAARARRGRSSALATSLDQTDLQVCLNIQRVKLCMAEGVPSCSCTASRCTRALYDLLNQHYVQYGGRAGCDELRSARSRRLCPIHPQFRVVVVVEKLERARAGSSSTCRCSTASRSRSSSAPTSCARGTDAARAPTPRHRGVRGKASAAPAASAPPYPSPHRRFSAAARAEAAPRSSRAASRPPPSARRFALVARALPEFGCAARRGRRPEVMATATAAAAAAATPRRARVLWRTVFAPLLEIANPAFVPPALERARRQRRRRRRRRRRRGCEGGGR